MANPATQEMLSLHMTGKAGEWSYETDAGEEYIAQMLSEERRPNTKTGVMEWVTVRRANHLRDIERMILTLALASGILRA
jgi:hypothetical protein